MALIVMRRFDTDIGQHGMIWQWFELFFDTMSNDRTIPTNEIVGSIVSPHAVTHISVVFVVVAGEVIVVIVRYPSQEPHCHCLSPNDSSRRRSFLPIQLIHSSFVIMMMLIVTV